MLAAGIQKHDAVVGNPSVDPSIIPVMVVSNETAAATRSVVSAVNTTVPTDAAMKVDERDPIEPDSNEGTEGIRNTENNCLCI
jgi:hypothetical protein